MNSVIVISASVMLVILTGVFTGAETGIYRLSRLRLRLGIEKKRLSFIILGKCLHDSAALLISILIVTNALHYANTSIVTYMLLSKVESAQAAEFLATVIMAPLLFVFAELIPKNLFFYRADSLMPYVAPVLLGAEKFCTWCGIVPVLKSLSGFAGKVMGAPLSSRMAITNVPRHQINAILSETGEEDFLSSVQTDIINRLGNISRFTVQSVMTAMVKAEMVDLNCDRSSLLSRLKKSGFTRLPVYKGSVEDIVGFVNVYEVLSSKEEFSDLGRFVKPMREFPTDTTVIDAMNIMQRENEKMALVVRISYPQRKRPVGLVTMKDLIEELVGELAEW